MAKLTRILAIDGGGIRGLIPAKVIGALESRLQKLSGDEDARVVDYFDLIAGTSTGGVLACLLLCPDGETSRPRYSGPELADLYLSHGAEIFSVSLFHRLLSAAGLGDEKYPADGLERVLRNYFGDLWMSQLLKPCLITGYDIRRRRATFFTQHDARQTPARDFLVRDVARATTAAPTYFEAPLIRSRTEIGYPIIDGGVFANNPSLCAYAEARKLFGYRAAQMAILSVGTGAVRKSYFHEEAKDWGAIGWMKPLVDIMMSGVSETVDYECRQAFEAVNVPEQYLRINVEMDRLPPGVSSDLDDAQDRNLRGLAELGAETAERFSTQLDNFAQLLIDAQTTDDDST
ncbi:MAG: patatin-like phospholipase family protein [Pirellulaceae bacterium]